MTPTEVKKAADEMVEMLRPMCTQYVWTGNGYSIDKNESDKLSIQAAIAHCKRVIEVLELSTPGAGRATQQILYRLILSELEGRVK